MTGAEEGRTPPLLAVRAGEGGFRIVTHSAREAVAIAAEMRARGLSDVHVLAGGQRLDAATLAVMVAAEASDPPANGQG